MEDINSIEDLQIVKSICSIMLQKFSLVHIVVKMGRNGVLLASITDPSTSFHYSNKNILKNPIFSEIPAIPISSVVNTSGAGIFFLY